MNNTVRIPSEFVPGSVEFQEGRPVQKGVNQLTRQAGLAYSGSAPKKPMNDYVPEDEGKTIDVPQAQRKSSAKEAVENSSGKTSPKPEAKPQVIPNLQDFAPKPEEQKDPEKIKEELVKLYTEQFETEGTGEKYEDAQKKVSQTIKPRINWLQKILFGALNMNTERWAKIDTEAREKAMKIVADRKKAEKEGKGDEEEESKTVRIAQPMLQHQAGPPSGGTPPGGSSGRGEGGENPSERRVQRQQLEKYAAFRNEREATGQPISKDELKEQYLQLLDAQNRLTKAKFLREDDEVAQEFRTTLLKIYEDLEDMGTDPRELDQLIGEPEYVLQEQKALEKLKQKIRDEEGLPSTAEISQDKIEDTLRKIAKKEADDKEADRQENDTRLKLQIFQRAIKWPAGSTLPREVRKWISNKSPEYDAMKFQAWLKAKINDGTFKEKPATVGQERMKWLPESIQEFSRVWMEKAPDQFQEDGEYPLISKDEQGRDVFHPENFIHLLISNMRQINTDAGDDAVSFWQKLSWDFGGGARFGFETVIDNIGLFFRDAESGKDLVELFELSKALVWQMDWARGTWQIYNQYKGDADQVIKVLAQRYATNTFTKYFKGVMNLPGFTETAPISNFFKGGKGFSGNAELGTGIRAATTAYRYLDDYKMLTRTFGKYVLDADGEYVKDPKTDELLIQEDSWKESAFFNNKAYTRNYIEANIVSSETVQGMREKFADDMIDKILGELTFSRDETEAQMDEKVENRRQEQRRLREIFKDELRKEESWKAGQEDFVDHLILRMVAGLEGDAHQEATRIKRILAAEFIQKDENNRDIWVSSSKTAAYKKIEDEQREDFKFAALKQLWGESDYNKLIDKGEGSGDEAQGNELKGLRRYKKEIEAERKRREDARNEKGFVTKWDKSDDLIKSEVEDEFKRRVQREMFEKFGYSDKRNKDGVRFFDEDGNFQTTARDANGKEIFDKDSHGHKTKKIDMLQKYIDDKVNYFRDPQKVDEQIRWTDSRIKYSLAYHVDNKNDMKAYTFDSINLLSAEIAQLYSSWINMPFSVGYQDTNVRTYDKGGERDALYRLNQAEARKGQNLGRFSASQKYFYQDGYNAMKDLLDNSIGSLIQGGDGSAINFRKGYDGDRGTFRTETMTKYITDDVIRGNTLKEALYAGEDFDITGLVKHHFDPFNPNNSRLEIDWQKFYQHRKVWNAFRYRYSATSTLKYDQVERARELKNPRKVGDGFRYFDSTTAERTFGYSILNQKEFLMKVDVDDRYETYIRRKLQGEGKTKEEIEKAIEDMPKYTVGITEDGKEIKKLIVRDDPKDEHSKNRSQFGQNVHDNNYPDDPRRMKVDAYQVELKKNKEEMWKWVLIREYAEMLKQHRRKGHKAGLVAEYKDGYTVEAFIEMLELIEGDAEFDPITDEVIMHNKVFNHDHIKYLRKYAGVSKWNTIGREVRMEMAKEVRESFAKFMKTLIGSATK